MKRHPQINVSALFVSLLSLGCLWSRSHDASHSTAAPLSVPQRSDAPLSRGVLKLIRGEKLDLNRVTLQELRMLPFVSRRAAEAIVAHRESHGPFRRFDDLEHLRGVGKTTILRLERWLEIP